MSYRVVVLISGSGSNLQALLDAQHAGILGATEVVLVVSDRADAYGLQRALGAGIPALSLPLPHPRQAALRTAWEGALADVIAAYTPDLIVLSGFMRVLSATFLGRFPDRVINQHPAMLPEPGTKLYSQAGVELPVLRGAHVVADALRAGLPVTGCTIHRATPAVDDGPVLARAEVPILPSDDETALHERIKTEERRLLVEVVRRLAHALA